MCTYALVNVDTGKHPYQERLTFLLSAFSVANLSLPLHNMQMVFLSLDDVLIYIAISIKNKHV